MTRPIFLDVAILGGLGVKVQDSNVGWLRERVPCRPANTSVFSLGGSQWRLTVTSPVFLCMGGAGGGGSTLLIRVNL